MSRPEKSRGLRDEANVGPDPRRARELRPLKDLKWKVADGEPDIRGWSVFASTGRELGVVDELLVDSEAREVVMLDIDLKRDDRHTLAPVRAAWIDRPAKRVVVDARELGADESLPALPRAGALSDEEVTRFNDGYVRAYGNRGYEADRTYRLRRGDDDLEFGADAHRTPRRLLDAGAAATGVAASDAYFDESRAINRELVDLPRDEAATRDADRREARAEARSAELRDEARLADRRPDEDRELERVPESEGIEPRELDARVRIDEGATVDDRTPVAAVRYPDERVVSRHRRRADDLVDDDRISATDAERRLGDTSDGRVRYRNYGEDAGRPDDLRP